MIIGKTPHITASAALVLLSAFVDPAWTQTVLPAGIAGAQRSTPLERHLPPVPERTHSDIAPRPAASAEDPTPLGVHVKRVRIFGLAGKVAADFSGDIEIESIEGVSEAEIRKAIAPFLHKPLSMQLIAQMRAALVQVYREAGKPLVSVSAPPQEVTGGGLQLQVVPYRLGETRARDAATGAPAAAVARSSDLRANVGELIDTRDLSEDIDWLNRFPYRQINGVFEPGSLPGTTDLTLNITRDKPWRAHAGYTNSGSRDTGYDRYFAGFAAGIEALNDLTLSYQLTGSDNFWTSPSTGRLAGHHWPDYLSHAGRIAIPTLARQGLDISPNFIATRQQTVNGILSFRNTTFELPVLYKSALSNIWSGAPFQGEIYAGTAPKWAKRKFASHTGNPLGDFNLASQSATFNLMTGLSATWGKDGGASHALDLRIVANTGGVLPGNTDSIWNAWTNGRVTTSRYVYGLIQFDRHVPLDDILPFKGFGLSTSLTGQIASRALPDTEQLTLGGASATRGYASRDGAVDAGIVLRHELRLPAFALLKQLAGSADSPPARVPADSVSPYLFLDLGYGHNFYNRSYSLANGFPAASVSLASAGLGLDYQIERNLQASLSAAWALKDAPDARRIGTPDLTRQGDMTIHARLILSY